MVTLLPSQATRNISVAELDVGTSLSISAPASVAQGAGFEISGILLRNDTAGPVPYVSIALSYNGTSLGSATTGLYGDYSKSVSIPSVGAFTLTASFAGASGFMGSEAFKNISIGGLIVSSALLIPVFIGGLIAYLSRR